MEVVRRGQKVMEKKILGGRGLELVGRDLLRREQDATKLNDRSGGWIERGRGASTKNTRRNKACESRCQFLKKKYEKLFFVRKLCAHLFKLKV